MSSRPLLDVGSSNPDYTQFQRTVDRLERELRDAKLQIEAANNRSSDALRALKILRKQLEPMYNALRMVFGELENAGIEAAEDSPLKSSSPKSTSVWESWKSKLGGKQADFIQAFLDHGEMNATQLSVVTHTHPTNISKVIYKLNRVGLISKNGNKYSLKEL